MIEKYTFRKVCVDLCYIGTTYISTTKLVVYFLLKRPCHTSRSFSKMCKIFQQFKKRNTIYRNLPPKNIAELKPWVYMYVDLIYPYINSIRQQQPWSTVINKNASLTYMSGSIPRWKKLTSGYHNYPLNRLSLWYIYCSKKTHFWINWNISIWAAECGSHIDMFWFLFILALK